MESIRKKVPVSAKRLARSRVFAYRKATQARRALPGFLIIGAQRCGTSSFYELLSRHPSVIRAFGKEIHFFDLQWSRGVEWYRAHFPLLSRMRALERRRDSRVVTGEATPYYLFHPHAARRAFQIVPNARLIVLLRDPVERAISHHQWMVRHGFETLPLQEALDAEPDRLGREEKKMIADPMYDSPKHRQFGYVARGRYAEQLRVWMNVFSPEQFLLIRSEDLFERPSDIALDATNFLGLAPSPPARLPRLGSQEYKGDPDLTSGLAEYFRECNEQLYEMAGRDFGWMR
jgi:hypothetical protein